MKLLAVGDVYGEAGLKAVKQWLPRLRDEHAAGFVVVNAENLHNGRGVDASGARALFEAGADCLTSGNHIWGHKDHAHFLERETRLLRPLNYPAPCPGQGVGVGVSRDGVRVAVINLIGRLFMTPVDDPFQAADAALTDLAGQADVVVVDFHAEATSEKQALAFHLDGRVAAVFGTHTHVQTADARVLPRGTGYITDLGMTGPYDSIIGMAVTSALPRLLSGRPTRPVPADGAAGLRGALFTLDEARGLCDKVERIAVGPGGA